MKLVGKNESKKQLFILMISVKRELFKNGGIEYVKKFS